MSPIRGWARAYQAAALVSAVPIWTLVAGLLGVALDRLVGSGWIFMVCFGFLGFFAGLLQLSRGLRKLSDADPPDHPP